MKRETIFCKSIEMQVNKFDRCPEWECRTCPELRLPVKPQKTKQTIPPPLHKLFKKTYTEEIHSKSEEPLDEDFVFAHHVYSFLKDIMKLDTKELSGHCSSLQDFKSFMETHPFLFYKNQLSYVQDCLNTIDTMFFIKCRIERSKKQKQNIPLDCFLFLLHSLKDKKPDIQSLLNSLIALNMIDDRTDKHDALVKRIQRVRKDKEISQITSAATKVLPLFYLKPELSVL